LNFPLIHGGHFLSLSPFSLALIKNQQLKRKKEIPPFFSLSLSLCWPVQREFVFIATTKLTIKRLFHLAKNKNNKNKNKNKFLI
jgi:hypothetical protein